MVVAEIGVVHTRSGDVMCFSTARTTPSEVQIPMAVDPSCTRAKQVVTRMQSFRACKKNSPLVEPLQMQPSSRGKALAEIILCLQSDADCGGRRISSSKKKQKWTDDINLSYA